MKKILLTVSTAAILLTACNSDKKDTLSTDKQVVFSDTSSLNKSNPGTDVPAAGVVAPVVAPAPVAAAPQPQVRTVTKYITVHDKPRSKVPISTNTTPPVAQAPVSTAPPSTAGGTTGTSTTGTTTGTNGTTGTTPATIPEKKNTGWSQTAKDATIGGVGGAVIGAVIGKGAKGAVIGGVIGAAGGYILGRKADKASGRIGTNTTNTTNTSTTPPQ